MMEYSISYIRELYQKLPNESAVATELGVSRQFLYEFRCRHKINYNPKAKTAERVIERKNKIISMIEDKSVDDISKVLGISKTSINKIIGSEKMGRKSQYFASRNAKILELRNSGISVKELAEQFGLRRQVISNLIYKSKHNDRREDQSHII
jgi:DNA-binding XRE family transcriptional regulator